jgi:hypothetical protein
MRPRCPEAAALQTNFKTPENKAALQAACFEKCMYCESKVRHVYWGDVEHIRPKSLFPALEFVWENLGYVCARCNGAKGDKWNNEAPLIDPFTEEPDDHLAGVGAFIMHRNGSERGEYTCITLTLNRPELIERRMERIQQIAILVDKASRTHDAQLRKELLRELQIELKDDREYAMVSRAAYRQLTNDWQRDE